ncbi:MAG: flavodoxin domain-containing protein, partial [Candidatus Melainabacteria bacterium]|nr:flavodoxin domain-containing protein [Candidatus Melainabacteria bacterium]
MADMPPQSSHDPSNEAEHSITEVKHFFAEFWPVVLFGSFFLLTMTMPMVFSGFLTLQVFGIVSAFLVGLALTFTLHWLLRLYVPAVALVVFLCYPEVFYNDGKLSLSVYFLAAVTLAAFFILHVKPPLRLEKPKAEKAVPSSVPVEAAADEAVAPEKPAFKPVRFDRTTAAQGVSLIYGSESGNAKGLADMAADELKAEGYAVQVLDAEWIDVQHLPAFANLLVLTSTWGDGEPPSNALELVESMAKQKVALAGRQFSVLALGDTSYPQFCECGKVFDRYLSACGAKRIHDRVDCDLDYEKPFRTWLDGVKGSLKSSGLSSVEAYVEPVTEEATP